MENSHNSASLQALNEKLKSLINPNNKAEVDEMLIKLIARLQDPNIQQFQEEENDEEIDEEINNFDYKKCEAYKKINEKFQKPTHQLLISIANAISKDAKIKELSREQKRKKCLTYKWYIDNWVLLEPHLNEIKLIYDNTELENLKEK